MVCKIGLPHIIEAFNRITDTHDIEMITNQYVKKNTIKINNITKSVYSNILQHCLKKTPAEIHIQYETFNSPDRLFEAGESLSKEAQSPYRSSFNAYEEKINEKQTTVVIILIDDRQERDKIWREFCLIKELCHFYIRCYSKEIGFNYLNTDRPESFRQQENTNQPSKINCQPLTYLDIEITKSQSCVDSAHTTALECAASILASLLLLGKSKFKDMVEEIEQNGETTYDTSLLKEISNHCSVPLDLLDHMCFQASKTLYLKSILET